LTATGELDPTFGSGGKVINSFSSVYEVAYRMVVQPDDKIILAGQIYDSYVADASHSLLVRYTSNGSLDGTFGNGGAVISDFSEINDGFLSVALQPDGRIVAAGQIDVALGDEAFSVARFHDDGTIDTSFSGGHVVFDFGSGYDYPNSVGIQSDGKIVLAGATQVGDSFALARLLGYDVSIVGNPGDDTIRIEPGSLAGTL